MKRVFIFGAGGFGKEVLYEVCHDCEVLGFLDNDEGKWGNTIDGVTILGGLRYAVEHDHDEIVLGTMAYSIVDGLVELGESRNKINTRYIDVKMMARSNFLRDFANLYLHQHNGIAIENCCVAEGGVFRGEFAKEINREFKELDLYLFDTFEGFDERDTELDKENGLSDVKPHGFGFTSEKEVLSICPYPEKVHIIKGWFPDTTKMVSDDIRYVFVNLDFDLYSPTLEGLKYFYPKMVTRGVILMHDYYHINYKGVPKAIDDYQSYIGKKILRIPIGDHCSMAVIKT